MRRDLTPDGDAELIGAKFPEWLADMVKNDPRSNSEVLRTAVLNAMGGERKSAIETRLSNKDEIIGDLKRSIEDDESELEYQKEQRDMLEQKLTKASDTTDSDEFREVADSMLDEVIGSSLHLVEEVAEKHTRDMGGDISPSEARKAAMKRAVETDRTIPAKKFYPVREIRRVQSDDTVVSPVDIEDKYTDAEIERVLDAPAADEISVEEMDDWEAWT